MVVITIKYTQKNTTHTQFTIHTTNEDDEEKMKRKKKQEFMFALPSLRTSFVARVCVSERERE